MKQSTAKAMFSIGVLSLLTASFFVVTGGNAAWEFWRPWSSSPQVSTGTSSSSLPTPAAPVMGRAGSTEDQIIDVVKRSQDSVASVIITEELPVLQQEMQSVPLQGFPFDNSFFGQFNIQVPRYVQKGTQKQEVGGGTAFFVTSDGLLMTNKHVVEDPQAQYTVLLNDGRKLDAKVAAIDPANDIALIRVQGSGFTPLTIASNDDLQLGQTAIAIGNSLGEFRNTVSVGVVSGLRRTITAGGLMNGQPEQLDQIIQTDAAINQGNSGGPLLNSRGEVIGMNTAVAASAQNIGFALPAKELRRVMDSFRKNGRIVSAFLGVRYTPVTEEVRKKYNLSATYGVYVKAGQNPADKAVTPGSPAHKAGIQDGDIILEANGQKLTPDNSLQRLVQSMAPGDELTLRISRKGEEKTVTAVLAERPTK
jgi:S1-C subfamily serine protease